MYKQNINIRKDIRNLKRSHKEILDESTITEMKSSLQRFIGKFEQVEGRTSRL